MIVGAQLITERLKIWIEGLSGLGKLGSQPMGRTAASSRARHSSANHRAVPSQPVYKPIRPQLFSTSFLSFFILTLYV
jgi:hypothetical protein